MNEPLVSAPLSITSLLTRLGTSFKMAGVAILILVLLIPLQMVRSILRERLARRNEAVSNITASWGREQKLVGPVLVIPYRYAVKGWKEQVNAAGKSERVETIEMVKAQAYFLPTNLAIRGQVAPSTLRRGIYKAVVYSGQFEWSGDFAKPDFGSLKIDQENVLWDEAMVAFAIPDLRGVKETLKLGWNGESYPLLSGSKLKGFTSGITARVAGLRASKASIPFRLELTLNGSGGLSIAPVGAQTTVNLTSPWPDPSFYGGMLPAERSVTRDGFEATWKMSSYARDYAQQWTDQEAGSGLSKDSAEASLFGVTFLSGIDAYRNTERAIKYGALFIVLVFAAFFLFEVLAGLRIHPFQYAIAGAALCLFYLGLLSLSEFISFGISYWTATALTVVLVCFHSARMLQSGVRTLIVAGLLSGIYGYLYVALQLQDYALLLGTAGLFAMLAAIVFVTRNIDWYAWDKKWSADQLGASPRAN